MSKDKISRRTFLQKSGLMALGAALVACKGRSTESEEKGLRKTAAADKFEAANPPSKKSDSLLLDSAALFLSFDFPVHGIDFDSKGLMYVGGRKDIHTVSPSKEIKHFVTLDDSSEKTIIWALRFGPDGDLYAAAHERIVKISREGQQSVVIKEAFPGPCGVTDLRFDRSGDLYIAYDNVIAKYDADYRKSIIIDGNRFEPSIGWAVGLEFNPDFNQLYLADCRGKNAYIVRHPSKNVVQESVSHAVLGQYFTSDRAGNIYLTCVGPQPRPEFVKFTPDGQRIDVFCEDKPTQYKGYYKKAMAWGKTGFDERSIYCIIGNDLYQYGFSKENVIDAS